MKVGGDLPFLKNNDKAECSNNLKGGKTICSRTNELKHMRRFLIANGNSPSFVKSLSDKVLLNELMSVLDVDTEAKIYEHEKWRRFYGGSLSDNVLVEEFTIKGPKESVDLLDNFKIDKTLAKWSESNEWDTKMYHVPFQMIDFERTRSQLATLDIHKLMKDNYKCFACVLNTDVSSGRGKHWFCLYGDLNHKGTKDDPIIIEYFNSSGYPPREEITNWLEKTRRDLLKKGVYVDDLRSTKNKQLQFSRTECGVWCLSYIAGRLMNYDPHFMLEHNTNDTDMYQFRKKIFRL